MSENISYSLSQVVITYFINQISNEALAARTYCYNMIMFVYLFCVSITQGGDILVGHLVDQWRHQAAYVLGNYFFRLAMIITVSGSILLALAGPSILHAFTDNEEIIRMGVWVLVVDVFLEIGRTSNIFAGCLAPTVKNLQEFPLIKGADRFCSLIKIFEKSVSACRARRSPSSVLAGSSPSESFSSQCRPPSHDPLRTSVWPPLV